MTEKHIWQSVSSLISVRMAPCLWHLHHGKRMHFEQRIDICYFVPVTLFLIQSKTKKSFLCFVFKEQNNLE